MSQALFTDRRQRCQSFARSCVTLATFAVVGLATPAAHAADACFAIAGNTLVLKAFGLPGKNVCKDARGWLQVGSSSPWRLDGNACGSSDGAQLRSR